MKIMGIDPGVPCGWAVFENKQLLSAGICKPFYMSVDEEWLERSSMTACLIGQEMLQYEPDMIICEWPGFFQSAGGTTTARSGALVKLAAMVGRILQLADEHNMEVKIVEVNKWKGQLPKSVVSERIMRRPEVKGSTVKLKSHMIDAVGIALYGMGVRI